VIRNIQVGDLVRRLGGGKELEGIRPGASAGLIVGILVFAGIVHLAVLPAGAVIRNPMETLTLNSQVWDIEVDPARPLAYLSARENGSVIVFSFVTLEIVAEIPVGPEPFRMDIDPRTDRLYVALGGGPGVAVVNLSTLTADAVWSVGSGAVDVAVGGPGRIYVTRAESTTHPAIVDSITGAFVANITSPAWVSWGALLDVSPDGRTLYLAEYETSPSTLYRLDITTDNPVITGQTSAIGSNLHEIVLSVDGRTLYSAAGAPDYIHVMDTGTASVIGRMDTGAYPSTVARSPDGSVVLGGKDNPSDHAFYTFDPTTYQRLDAFHTSEEPWQLAMDSTNEYLLAFNSNYLAPPYLLSVFSMSTPPNTPPVARFAYSPLGPFVGQTVSFEASYSTDSDGDIVRYEWRFGDGWTGSGVSTSHVFSSAGTFTVNLTVTDDTGQWNTTTQLVTVSTPPDPTASFTAGIGQHMVGDLVLFDGSGSSDPVDAIVEWAWTFGDGTGAAGVVVEHAFVAAGTFPVTLTVRNGAGRTGNTTQGVTIAAAPLLDLVMYSHSSGFRLPVPSAWPRDVDRDFEGEVIELVLIGPDVNGFGTNIVVDTGHDSTVRETDAYLRSLVDDVMASIRRDSPDARLERLEMRPLSGHAAVVFTVSYPTESLTQKMVVVVSDPHDRYWILLLSARSSYFAQIDPTFERMLQGFEITLGVPILGIPAEAFPLVCGAGIILVVIVVLAAVLFRRRKKALPPPIIPAYAPPAYTPPPQGVRCPSCRGLSGATDRFCERCGYPFGPRPSSLPPPPPPP